MLGPLQVHDRAGWVSVPAEQQRLVLAVLLANAEQVVSTERLVDAVWEDRPPRRAINTIQAYVMRLRRLLDDGVLVTRGHGYQLLAGDDDVDAAVFEHMVASGRSELDTGQAESGARLLAEALALWRGPVFADVPASRALTARVAQLEQMRLAAEEDHVGALLDLGRHDKVVDDLHRQVDRSPLRERRWVLLMRALDRCGRRAEALEAFHRARRVLGEELGLEPGPELSRLQQAILTGNPPDAEPTPLVVPAQLPADVAGFTGRAGHLQRLDDLLHPDRGLAATAVVISAIEGTAGVGKTALAVHWAHRVRDRFPDGQLYVNLRGFHPGGQVMEPAAAVRGFLDAFGVPAERVPADPDAQVALYRSLLADKRVLVVLDNARDAEQVRPLLPGTGTALVVVTSRSQLTSLMAADGAQPLTLDLLTHEEASELLQRRLSPERVSAEPEAAEQVISACARLPLALAVAGARAAQTGFPLTVLAAELADTRGRLGVLDAGDAATQVRAVFSWSYTTLTPAAARLFRLLGLHPGPDTSAAAAASLAGLPRAETGRLLAELTRASLTTEHVPGRYGLHDLLAAYAADLCDTTDPDGQRRAATSRLLDHYTHSAHTADRLLDPARDPIQLPLAPPAPGTTREQPADRREAMAWLDAEHPVLLAALRLAAATGSATHTWQLAWTLDTFLNRRGHWRDLAGAWQAAVAAADRLAHLTATGFAHRTLAWAGIRLGRYGEAHTHLRRALDLHTRADNRAEQAKTHHALAVLLERQDRPDRALDHAQQALTLCQAAGRNRGQASALNMVGWCRTLLGDHTQALTCCQQALILYRQIGDRQGEAATWDSLGYAHHHLHQHVRAADCYQHALTLVRDLADRYSETAVLTHLGDTHHAAGNPAAARVAWQQALSILTDLHHPDAGTVRAKLHALDRLRTGS